MDKEVYEVRLAGWKQVVQQCQERPAGMTQKEWLAQIRRTEYLQQGAAGCLFWQELLEKTQNRGISHGPLLPWSDPLPAQCHKPRR